MDSVILCSGLIVLLYVNSTKIVSWLTLTRTSHVGSCFYSPHFGLSPPRVFGKRTVEGDVELRSPRTGSGARLFHDVFPFNGFPRIFVSDGLLSGRRLAVTDTTLRDGQQGWRPLRVEEGVRIYEFLVELGGRGAIESTELFLYTHRDRELARRIREYGVERPYPVAWIRSTLSDLRLVLEAGFDETIILASISDYHIYYKLGVDRQRAIEKYVTVIGEALRRGIAVRCALEDITRADFDKNVRPLVERLVRLSEEHGTPIRFKLSDTLGLGLPYPDVPPPRGIPALIRRLRGLGLSTSQLEFHGHNDLGLVVANHLAAWIYGADYSNCTLFGIGERAGNCPLEVMLVHYAGLTGRLDDMDLSVLPRVAEFFEEMGYRVPEFTPLVGRNAFNTKAGIHIDGLLKNPEIYLPFNPSLVGRSPGIEVNAYGGRAAIVAWLRLRFPEIGKRVDKNDPRVVAMHNEIVGLYERGEKQGSLSDDELVEIASKYFPELAMWRG